MKAADRVTAGPLMVLLALVLRGPWSPEHLSLLLQVGDV